MIAEIQELRIDIEKQVQAFLKDEQTAFADFYQISNRINQVFGVVLPIFQEDENVYETIIGQLQRLTTGVENRDVMQIVDTLTFEINDTLTWLLSVMSEGE